MIALMGEGPLGPSHRKIKELKTALRRVLRAAAALESERKGDGTLEELIAVQKAYDKAVAQAQKALK